MSLRCEIKLLEEGGTGVLDQWIEEISPERDSEDYELSNWQKAAVFLLERSRHASQGCEVFIFLLGNPLDEGWDRSALERLLKEARYNCWGAPIYLVVSSEIQADEKLLNWRVSLRKWMETVVAERVKDLLQLEYQPMEEITPEESLLREACDESRDRQELLEELPDHGSWVCALGDTRWHFRQLLGSLGCMPGGDVIADHWIVLVDREDSDSQADVVHQKLVEFRTGKHLIVTLGAWPSEKLVKLCTSKGLAEPLRFQADLEIWHLLLWLNQRQLRLQERRGDAARLRLPGVRFAGQGESGPFQPFRTPDPVPVLLTNAFDAALDQPGQVQEAARDIGELLEETPPGSRTWVEIRTVPKRLIDRIRSLSTKTLIWVHIGHGLGPDGLEDADRNAVSPDRWVSCFGGWRGRMPLALLLCCRSAETAERLVRAGVRVAIGFEGEVLSDQARILAGRILRAALEHHGDRNEVLNAFDRGRAELKGAEPPNQQSRPVAICHPS